MDYAEAMNRLNDQISSILAKGESWGLSDQEMAEELIRIANELTNSHPKDTPDRNRK